MSRSNERLHFSHSLYFSVNPHRLWNDLARYNKILLMWTAIFAKSNPIQFTKNIWDITKFLLLTLWKKKNSKNKNLRYLCLWNVFKVASFANRKGTVLIICFSSLAFLCIFYFTCPWKFHILPVGLRQFCIFVPWESWTQSMKWDQVCFFKRRLLIYQ